MPPAPSTNHARDIQAHFDALVDAAVDAVIQIDRKGLIKRFNRAAEQIFGYSSDETLNRNVSMLMPEPYGTEHDDYLQRYEETGERRIIGIGREVQGRHKNGQVFPIELSVGEARLGGTRLGYVGIIRDITQRKLSEERLRQQEEELRLIFENTPTGMLIGNLEGCITRANPACCELLGYSEKELTGMSYRDISHPDDVDKSTRHFRKLLSGAVDSYRLEKRYLHKSGRVIHAVLHNGVIHDADGRPMLLMAEIEDQTERINAEQEASEMRNAFAHVSRVGSMGEMASGIAHELNQPLTAIASYARASHRLLTADEKNADECLQTLDKIAAQAERAGDIIKRLRSMLRQSDDERESLDCNELIHDLLALINIELRSLPVMLRLDLNEALPQVMADYLQLQQVIHNLIKNAAEAMQCADTGDEILITSRPHDGGVEIQVCDEGPGINEDEAERLFEPFYTTKENGMGIGLSLCRTILRAHGGGLRVANRVPNGANFRLWLPGIEDS